MHKGETHVVTLNMSLYYYFSAFKKTIIFALPWVFGDYQY